MNNNIKDKTFTNNDDEIKNHQAYFMEFSRLKKLKENCLMGDCNEFISKGGEHKFIELQNLVKNPQTNDRIRRDTQSTTNPQSPDREKQDPTKVSTPNITRGADHSGGEKKKNYTNIISNSQALNEEINSIKYLIEYMNNNNKKQNL